MHLAGRWGGDLSARCSTLASISISGHTERLPGAQELYADGPHIGTFAYEVSDHLERPFAIERSHTIYPQAFQRDLSACDLVVSTFSFTQIFPQLHFSPAAPENSHSKM